MVRAINQDPLTPSPVTAAADYIEAINMRYRSPRRLIQCPGERIQQISGGQSLHWAT
jgi:hypothetical protein